MRLKRRTVRHFTLGIQPHTPYQDSLRSRAEEAERVLGRTDATSSTLTAISAALLVAGAAGVGVTGQDATLPLVGRAGLVAALAMVAAALVLLLGAIRPRRGISGQPLSGVPLYATLSPTAMTDHVREVSEEEHLAERTVTVSRIAATKHRAQRRAVLLLIGAVATTLAAITAVAAAALI